MQRIDENTYIDDTLVTCAEYQLFIDEMRDQGKYYQPIHWTSYKFLKGQAKKPILGVQHTDALDFCEWLEKRDTGEWQYRLPNNKEAEASPIKFSVINPLGYWVGEKYQFVWISVIPNDAQALAIDRALNYAYQLNFSIMLGSNITSAYNFPRDLASDHTSVYRFVSALTKIRDYILNRSLDHTRNIANDLAIAIAYISDLDLNLDRERALALPQEIDRDRTVANDFNYAIDIYLDIFTFQERIAGRSPAFEGIRLVKERIR